MPSGGPWKNAADQRPGADMVVEPGGDVLGHHRDQHEQAPHAVDDRRDAREQFDGRADRATRPARRDLGQEEGDAEADRHRDEHRDHRRDDGAVDRHQRAVLVLDGVPLGRDEEVQAGRGQHLAATPQHRQGGAGEREQHEHDGADQHVAEQAVVARVFVVASAVDGGDGEGGGVHGEELRACYSSSPHERGSGLLLSMRLPW